MNTAVVPVEVDAGLELLSLDEFVQPIKVSWLVRDLIPADAIVVVFGPPKSGKTFAVTDLAMHVAHGMHWRGNTISKALRVAFLSGEGHRGLKVRLHAWRCEHGAILREPFHILPEAISLTERSLEVLELLRPVKPELLIVDTLNAYFGAGDENSTQDMTGFVAAVRLLRQALGCSVIVIHHTGLADNGRERGSTVLRGAADVIVQVARDDGGNGLVGFQVIAGRDLEAWESPISLRLRRVETDWKDDAGEPIDTCLVESGELPVTLPGRGGRPLGDVQSKLVEIAMRMASNAVNKTPAGEVLLARHDVAATAKAAGLSKQSISSAWAPLANRGFWRLVEPGTIAMKVPR